jgi:hypothetical protein
MFAAHLLMVAMASAAPAAGASASTTYLGTDAVLESLITPWKEGLTRRGAAPTGCRVGEGAASGCAGRSSSQLGTSK